MKAIANNKRFFKAQRERKRMHSLNKALDVLRKKLQHSLSSDLRLPKIEALKLGKRSVGLNSVQDAQVSIFVQQKITFEHWNFSLKETSSQTKSSLRFCAAACDKAPSVSWESFISTSTEKMTFKLQADNLAIESKCVNNTSGNKRFNKFWFFVGLQWLFCANIQSIRKCLKIH